MQNNFYFRLRYEASWSLMNKNGLALQILSDLEADLTHLNHCDFKIRRPIERLFDETLLMAKELNFLSQNRYIDLYDRLYQIKEQTNALFQCSKEDNDQPLSVCLDQEELVNDRLVGGKSSGIMALKHHFPDSVPNGFVLTTASYKKFLDENQLIDRIRLLFNNIDAISDQNQFKLRTETIRNWILSAKIPKSISESIKFNAQKFKEQSTAGWAVRSSATSEDSQFSFAGQFASKLYVPFEDLEDAYKYVLASKFTDRAVLYRLHCGFSEIDTPMAVLFMPMIDPAASGVIYTADPLHVESNQMIVNAVQGISEDLVQGKIEADVFILSRNRDPKLISSIPSEKKIKKDNKNDYISEQTISIVASLAYRAMEVFGHDMDIEWAVDYNGKVSLLQARRIHLATQEKIQENKGLKSAPPIVEAGITIFPGRAEGNVFFLSKEIDPKSVPKGSVVIVSEPTPELAVMLPNIAALIAQEGNVLGHLATLVREFSVPCIFQMGTQARLLYSANVVSLDATKRRVYTGSRWPNIKERVLTRIANASKHRKSGPLYDLVLSLNLLDPYSSSFKAINCRSIHDVVRFIHEMSVRTLFKIEDEQRGRKKMKYRLNTSLPIKFHLIDIDGCMPNDKALIEPEHIDSVPFKAFWHGMSNSKLHWPNHWDAQFAGLSNDFKEQVLGGTLGPRRPKDANYIMAGRDYININARLTYHYATIDAFVGKGHENNRINFRFRGGGASDENRGRRAMFLEIVLRQAGFGVDRRSDLVTSWFRRYPQKESENALEFLGKLMVCARQLDIKMKNDSDIKLYADYFIKENYDIFS
ncbi:MAG: pyruvate, water dikinase [Desulfobacterales bacterium]|nr:pyruvate, water dikinase [Desulfobacterales bacterium]MBF0395817.1 pyruvate, water dikinase [Desulfobacterales bacterium]